MFSPHAALLPGLSALSGCQARSLSFVPGFPITSSRASLLGGSPFSLPDAFLSLGCPPYFGGAQSPVVSFAKTGWDPTFRLCRSRNVLNLPAHFVVSWYRILAWRHASLRIFTALHCLLAHTAPPVRHLCRRSPILWEMFANRTFFNPHFPLVWSFPIHCASHLTGPFHTESPIFLFFKN